MSELRFLTAGESHGPALTAIIEGIPAGLGVTADEINFELRRRQQGYGRGGRMAIESDEVQILGGLRHGVTLGSPIAMQIANRDWANWTSIMQPGAPAETADTADARAAAVVCPRPGHADLAGGIKYGHDDMRNVLERASARETAARVAAGAVAKLLLREFGIEVHGWVDSIGDVGPRESLLDLDTPPNAELAAKLAHAAEDSPVRCPNAMLAEQLVSAIQQAGSRGDTLGGCFTVAVTGLPVGIGSHVHWDRRLEGRLAAGLMSLNGIKGVEVGLGFEAARRPGSAAHDEVLPPDSGDSTVGTDATSGKPPLPLRATNRAGGIEGGVTNGQPLVLRAAMKPISTLARPLRSVNLATGEPVLAHHERSDSCAVPAASVIGEAIVALELARSVLEKFGGDHVLDCRAAYLAYLERVAAALPWGVEGHAGAGGANS